MLQLLLLFTVIADVVVGAAVAVVAFFELLSSFPSTSASYFPSYLLCLCLSNVCMPGIFLIAFLSRGLDSITNSTNGIGGKKTKQNKTKEVYRHIYTHIFTIFSINAVKCVSQFEFFGPENRLRHDVYELSIDKRQFIRFLSVSCSPFLILHFVVVYLLPMNVSSTQNVPGR